MHGFSSHTYSFINAENERFWVKMHFRTQQGIENLGVGAVLSPFALKNFSSQAKLATTQKIVFFSWLLSGVIFLLFGALNFYTHIGLVVNTMPK